MKILLKSLLNAVPGAILSGFAWWTINDWFGNKQGGLLEKQAWPLNDVKVWIATASGLAVVGSAIVLLFAAWRRNQLRSTLMSLGLDVQEEIQRSDPALPQKVHCLKDWVGGYNYACGQVNGVDLQMLEFHREYRSSDRNVQTQRHTVILQPFPEELCAPVQLVRKLWSAMFANADGVVLNADQIYTDPRDIELLAEFNEAFYIAPPESLATPPAGYVDTIRPILQLPFVRAVMDSPFKWNFEISDGTLVMWQQNRLLTAGNVSAAITEAGRIREALTKTVRTSTPLTATSSFPIGVNLQMGPIVGGGCVGMFLALASFAPIFFLYSREFRWVIAIWPFYGFLVVGLSVIVAVKLFGRKD
ncbi:MAG: hypothetical protein NXI04_22010 [Planctomycetaceae bacterium]|nr:hypothetical protein [Planctomycetaceae bacterium]